MKLRLIIFDWDGTLADSEARIVASMQAAFRQTGLAAPAPGAVRQVIGLGLEEAMQTLLPGLDAGSMKILAARYRYHYLADQALPSPLFDGVRDTLDRLRGMGYRLAVATGKSRAGLERALSETALAEFIDGSRCADETRSKPHPMMLDALMEEFGLAAGACLMVGDTAFDLEMAGNAGMAALAVGYGAHSRETLMHYNPLTCLDDIRQLPLWLERHASTAPTFDEEMP